MLEYLRIRNFALIDDLRINFKKGLNILTGETGAGKSIIIGALNVILGEKANVENIRSGEDKAILEAMFDISNNLQVQSILNNSGIEYEKGEPLILRREINIDGKSRNYINSTPTTLSKLKEIGTYLVDIHGQHEHQSLLNVNTHMELLDRFGHLEKEKQELAERFKEYVNLKNTFEKLEMNEKEKMRMIDLLKFSINEIESANLKVGEDIELEKEYNILNNQEKIFQNIEEAYGKLYSSENDIYSNLKEVILSLSEIEKYDSNIVNAKQKLEEAYYQIEDVIEYLRDYKTGFEYSPERLDAIIDRMELISNLKKKYGDTIEDILNYKEKCIKDLDAIEQSEEEIEKIKSKIVNVIEDLNRLAKNLSGRRRVMAKLFEEKIIENLKELDMGKCVFNVNFSYKEDLHGIVNMDGKSYKLTENGIDYVEFLISTNVGEDVKPLKKIASGGEISRVMLALKTVLNEVDRVNTMVFDEIDVGIGGKTADVVGRKVKFLSKAKQIILITHQPQIARYADTHFFIEKQVIGNRTITKLKELSSQERIDEIARMLAGEKITETSLKHAKELLSLE